MENNPTTYSEEQLELFDRYLMHRMDASERDAFEQRLKYDHKLNETFKEYGRMVHVVEESALKEKLDNFHAAVDSEKSKVVPIKIPKRFNFLVAASIIFLIGLGSLLIFNLQSQSLFDEYFTPDPGLPTVMGSSDNYDFYEAMVDYKRKNYSDAITKWENLLVQKPQNDTLNYFLGSAFLASGQEGSSIKFLEKTASDENSVFYKEANFYLGLAYLKMEEESRAKVHLKNSNSKAANELILKMTNPGVK